MAFDTEGFTLEQRVNYNEGQLAKQLELIVDLSRSIKKLSDANQQLMTMSIANQMLITLLMVKHPYKEEVIEHFKKGITGLSENSFLNALQLQEFDRVLRMIEGKSTQSFDKFFN